MRGQVTQRRVAADTVVEDLDILKHALPSGSSRWVSPIRTIAEYRSDEPVELFSLDGRPHLASVRVAATDVSAYQALLSTVPAAPTPLEEVTR